jgi:hypothetical protein
MINHKKIRKSLKLNKENNKKIVINYYIILYFLYKNIEDKNNKLFSLDFKRKEFLEINCILRNIIKDIINS